MLLILAIHSNGLYNSDARGLVIYQQSDRDTIHLTSSCQTKSCGDIWRRGRHKWRIPSPSGSPDGPTLAPFRTFSLSPVTRPPATVAKLGLFRMVGSCHGGRGPPASSHRASPGKFGSFCTNTHHIIHASPSKAGIIHQRSVSDLALPLPMLRVAGIVPKFCVRAGPPNGATPYARRNKRFLLAECFPFSTVAQTWSFRTYLPGLPPPRSAWLTANSGRTHRVRPEADAYCHTTAAEVSAKAAGSLSRRSCRPGSNFA